MFLASNELDLRKVTEWSAKSWQLSAVATILVKGADASSSHWQTQVVEPLVPGKQHFQMLITSKLDHKLIERRRREEKLLWECSLFHPQ